MKLKVAAVVCLLAVAAGSRLVAVQAAPPIGSRQEFYKWFDTLGFAEIDTASLVARDDGGTWFAGDRSGILHELYFEPGGAPDRRRLIPVQLVRYYSQLPERGPATRMDTVAFARRVAIWCRSKAHEDDLRSYEFDDPVSLLTLSRACQARGESKLANELFKWSLARIYRMPDEETRPALELLRDRVAENLVSELHGEISSLDCSWQKCRDLAAMIVGRFPASRWRDSAQDYFPILDLEAKEDAAHRIRESDIDRLPLEARIDALIFELRNQRGSQIMNPGTSDVFDGMRRERSPASKLVKIGFPAFRKLVDCLDDLRLTRSTGSRTGGGIGGHSNLRMRDVAIQVLDSIAHRHFHETVYGYPFLDDQSAAAAKSQALAWWKETLKKGELLTMQEDVRRAGVNVQIEAKRLVELYPDQAFDAVAYCVEHDTAATFQRPQIVWTLARARDSRNPGFLKTLMNSDRQASVRAAAAEVLGLFEPEEAIAHIVSDLKSPGPLGGNNSGYTCDRSDEIRYLVDSERPSALSMLDSPRSREEVGFILFSLTTVATEGGTWHAPDEPSWPKPDAATRERFWRRAEPFLAHLLTDNTSEEGGATVKDRVVDGLTAGEMAAITLASRWPNRYRFNPEGSKAQRRWDRLACLNEWRRGAGLALVPLPSRVRPALSRLRAPFMVTSVTVGGNARPSDAWLRKVQALRGHKLDSQAMLTFVEAIIDNFPAGCRECKVRASRAAGEYPIELEIEFNGPAGTGDEWALQRDFIIDGKSVGGGSISISGGGGGSATSTPIEFKRMVKSDNAPTLEATFRANPRTGFYFSLDFTGVPSK